MMQCDDFSFFGLRYSNLIDLLALFTFIYGLILIRSGCLIFAVLRLCLMLQTVALKLDCEDVLALSFLV
jgi:hypothetical protein